MSIVFNPFSGGFDFTGTSSGGGPSLAERYALSFNNTTDWTLSAPDYTLTILAGTHGKGTNPSVHVFELVGLNYEQIVTNVTVNASGDVTLKVTQLPDNRFNGAILII